MLSKITVSPAPHISEKLSTRQVMGDVIIGLVPAIIAAGVFFRIRGLAVIGVCVAACIASEWVCNRIRKKPNSLSDLSAIVTGIILALSLPPAVPFSVAIIGSVFAIMIVKMLFGGLGSNVFNPAMAARIFLAVSFGQAMTSWTVPATIDPRMPSIAASNTEATTQATPLDWSKRAIRGKEKVETFQEQSRWAFWGEVGGCLGETSSLALIVGGLYLLVRRTITFHIPLAILLSAVVFSGIGWLLKPEAYVRPDFHLFTGGLLICAFFIATDPVTAPLSIKGMWIFGFGVGALTMLIRLLGSYPEGVMFAVCLMNAFTPLIDRFCKRIPAGGKPNV